MDNFLIDIGAYLGIMQLISVIVDWAKVIGFIKQPEVGAKVATFIQTALSIGFWVAGMFFPSFLDAIPILDQAADLLAQVGAGLLIVVPLAIALVQFVRDRLKGIPLVNSLLTRSVS